MNHARPYGQVATIGMYDMAQFHHCGHLIPPQHHRPNWYRKKQKIIYFRCDVPNHSSFFLLLSLILFGKYIFCRCRSMCNCNVTCMFHRKQWNRKKTRIRNSYGEKWSFAPPRFRLELCQKLFSRRRYSYWQKRFITNQNYNIEFLYNIYTDKY